MRFPIFARGANPKVDQPFLRKKLAYLTAEVEAYRADWVDNRDPRKGIVCREMGCFGPGLVEVYEATPENAHFTSNGELRGIKFIPPPKPIWAVSFSPDVCS